jgi:hypothetical protein
VAPCIFLVQQGTAANYLQPTLRCGFRQQLSISVRQHHVDQIDSRNNCFRSWSLPGIFCAGARRHRFITTGALRSNTSTLEIGAGNGLATRRLLDFGANPLTIVEPDKRFSPLLTSIAKLYKADLRFIEASFEDAELPRSHYDLVALILQDFRYLPRFFSVSIL